MFYLRLNTAKALKTIELEMTLLDATNNRQITDGSTVFFGDQVLINIKTRKGKNNYKNKLDVCRFNNSK